MNKAYDREARFPMDWNQWQVQWNAWRAIHAKDLQPAHKRFEGKNFLADERLGTWEIKGRTVELSEVTFPNLEDRDPQTGRLLEGHRRSIGITYGIGVDQAGTVVRTFAELEAELGIEGA